METQELSAVWKVVSWVLTAVVMFLLGMLGLIIADAVGSQSKFYTYGGFLIGWSSYGLIKAALLRLTNRNQQSNTSDFIFDETISIPYTTEGCEFNDAQKITHELRKSTLSEPFIWKYYMDFVKYALTESVYQDQFVTIEQNNNYSEDYCQELIGANYAKNHIFNDTEWSVKIQQEIAKNANTLEDVTQNAKINIKEILERINTANLNNDNSKDEFIIITARIGARKLWADMFEYSYKTEITKNKSL